MSKLMKATMEGYKILKNMDELDDSTVVNPTMGRAMKDANNKEKDLENAAKEAKMKVADNGALTGDNTDHESKKVKSKDLKKMHLEEGLDDESIDGAFAGVCPKCGSEDISYGKEYFNNDYLIFPAKCDSCGCEYRETYLLDFVSSDYAEDGKWICKRSVD